MSEAEERGEVGRELLIQGGVVAGALLAVAAAILSGAFPQPFPLVEFLLTVAAAAATREFGLALPGRGFASFVLGVMLFALLRHGWAYGALVALVGMPAGDIPFRRLPLRAALVNAGHLTFGTAGVGFLYEQLGGTTGLTAFGDANLLPLAALLISLPLLINATFYLELASAHATAWVDARLTLRWESIVYALSATLTAGFLWAAMGPQDARYRAAALVVMVGLAALAHYVARTGVRADELALIQRFTRTLATDVNLDRSFAAIQQLTQRLVPWDEMGFARYDDARHEMVVVADSALAGSEVRYHADQGLTGEAIRRRAPVIRRGGADQQGAATATTWPGSEILVPLYQGERLVGAWSVRHRDAAMYRELDAELLDSLAPNLALTLRLHALVAPLVNAGEQTTQYVEHLTATSQQIHASSEEVTAATQRAEAGATAAADLVSRAERAMEALHSGAQEAAAAGEETHRASQAVERAAQTVRAATQRTAAALERVGDTVGQGAAEVGRLREAAEQVGRFAETIGAVAAQTNMLALNATIEAARAGAHGSGFAVVADEVRRLAEQSGREAAQAARTTTDTRRVLDRAAELLERLRHEIGEIASAAQGWVAELERIVVASESAADLSTKMIEFPRRNIERTAEMKQMLERLRLASHDSAGEAQVVAAAAAEQLAAIENLSKSAIQLSQSADQLSQAARIVQA